MRHRRGLFAVAIALAILAPASTAFAYIDAGTGSYLLQLAIGSMMAAGVLGRLYWRRLKEFFSRSGSEPSDDDR
ncbi:MAG: hypothetical protein R6V07_11195 [Armatimonadota bacterium]